MQRKENLSWEWSTLCGECWKEWKLKLYFDGNEKRWESLETKALPLDGVHHRTGFTVGKRKIQLWFNYYITAVSSLNLALFTHYYFTFSLWKNFRNSCAFTLMDSSAEADLWKYLATIVVAEAGGKNFTPALYWFLRSLRQTLWYRSRCSRRKH